MKKAIIILPEDVLSRFCLAKRRISACIPLRLHQALCSWTPRRQFGRPFPNERSGRCILFTHT